MEIFLPERTRYSKGLSDLCASVCNPVWQVKNYLCKTHSLICLAALPGILLTCLIHPFWSVCSWKHCSHVLLWKQGSSDVLGDRAAYWGKNTMNFIYCLCGSYRKWNSEPEWNRASARVEWKKIQKGFWKSWAGSWSGLGRLRQQLLLSFIVLPTKNKHCSSPVVWESH